MNVNPEQHPPFRRVLIANRGEIAVRIIRTLREMGVESVALYSDADRESLHRSLADYAMRLPGSSSAETYLNIPLIAELAVEAGVDAVHPGYGFLSENAEFAKEIGQRGIKFIGPSPASIAKLGDKIAAKQLMREANVPVVPGRDQALANAAECLEVVQEIGLPVILKAAAGGGGRGMRVVEKMEDLADSFAACQREAKSYFGNEAVFCERFVASPRHIEFQVLCDQHGAGVHLFERDCSIQRRHQKLIEEAPSAYLNDEQRAKLGGIAVRAALAADYEGVGTVEFICESPENAYFMEMNTRIQVEHPVTEEITRTDLIAEQLYAAAGHPLRLKQEDIRISGHAIELRINAEDAAAGFAPVPGTITELDWPLGPGIRIDTHAYRGYTIPSYYDSMIAKLIAWAPTRSAAITRLLRALGEMRLGGIKSTADFHELVLDHEHFRSGHFDTGFVATEGEEILEILRGNKSMTTDEAPSGENAPLKTALAVAAATDFATKLTAGETGRQHAEAASQWALRARNEMTRSRP